MSPSGYEPSGPNYPDGMPTPSTTDGEGLFSTRARSHWLKFTVRLPEGTAPEMFSALYHPALTNNPRLNAFPSLAPMLYTRWGEVHYFLVQTGTTPGGMPLHTLRRRLRLLPPQTVDYVLPQAQATTIQAECVVKYPDVIPPIIVPTPVPGVVILRVPGPELINQNPGLRLPDLSAHPTGDDILLPDVISFEVKAAWFNNPAFEGMLPGTSPAPDRMPPVGLNTDEPFSDLKRSVLNPPPPGTDWRVFDTGAQPANTSVDWDNPIGAVGGDTGQGFLIPSNEQVPSRINVRVLQIKLRIWDPRNEQARQVTIVQES